MFQKTHKDLKLEQGEKCLNGHHEPRFGRQPLPHRVHDCGMRDRPCGVVLSPASRIIALLEDDQWNAGKPSS